MMWIQWDSSKCADPTGFYKMMPIQLDSTIWCRSNRIQQNDADPTGFNNMMRDSTKWCWSNRIHQMMRIQQDSTKWCGTNGINIMMPIQRDSTKSGWFVEMEPQHWLHDGWQYPRIRFGCCRIENQPSCGQAPWLVGLGMTWKLKSYCFLYAQLPGLISLCSMSV